MNGGILPLLLLFATVGIALSRAGRRQAWTGAVAAFGSALLVSLLPVPKADSAVVFGGLWLSMIVTAVMVYTPRSWPTSWSIPTAVNAGVWAGVLAGMSDMTSAVLFALPLLLLFVPGKWIADRGLGIGLKVAASWMIAIASLSLFVTQLPTPGYQADHMQ